MVVVLPYKLSFIEETYVLWDIIDYVIDGFFFVDMILTFLTTYVDSNEKSVIHFQKIAIRYLKFWFWIDFISVVPMDLFFENGGYTILLRISRLPKIYKFVRISRVMKSSKTIQRQNNIWSYFYDLMRLNPGIYRLLKNISYIFIFCHVFACVYHFCGVIAMDNDPTNWIWRNKLVNASPSERYLASVYWVAQTVITVGYGDVGAVGILEHIIAIIGMLAGVIFFSLTVGSLTSLISDMDMKNTAYESKLNKLIEIKKNFNVSNQVFSAVQRILKYDIFKSDENYTEFLDTLPESMRKEISFAIYKKLVKGIEFFDSQDDKEVISAVGPYLKKVIFSRGEVIFNEGEYANSMYFISKGTVGYVIPEHEDRAFLIAVTGNYFGEVDLIFSQTRKFKVVANTDVELLSLDREDFQLRLGFKFRRVAAEMRERAERRRVKQIDMYDKALMSFEEAKKKQSKVPSLNVTGMDFEGESFPLLTQVRNAIF